MIDRYEERGLTKIDENTFVRYRTDDQDLAIAVFFYADLKDYKEYFNRLAVFNLINGNSKVAV